MVRVGDRAPPFEAPDQSGTLRRLTDYRGRWLALFFYPRDETPGCIAEVCAFRDHTARLEDAGIAVVGVSRDTVESHLAFATRRRLPYPLLADPGAITRAYDAAWPILGLPRRVTYLIDPEGVVRARHHSEARPEGHVDAILAARAAVERSA